MFLNAQLFHAHTHTHTQLLLELKQQQMCEKFIYRSKHGVVATKYFSTVFMNFINKCCGDEIPNLGIIDCWRCFNWEIQDASLTHLDEQKKWDLPQMCHHIETLTLNIVKHQQLQTECSSERVSIARQFISFITQIY